MESGYQADALHLLESDPRTQHLSLDVTRTSENVYGVVYEIEGPIETPSGRIVRFCSIWQVDTGTEVPRFITMCARQNMPFEMYGDVILTRDVTERGLRAGDVGKIVEGTWCRVSPKKATRSSSST